MIGPRAGLGLYLHVPKPAPASLQGNEPSYHSLTEPFQWVPWVMKEAYLESIVVQGSAVLHEVYCASPGPISMR